MLSEIYQFRTINEKLATAGQPTEVQFSEIQKAGFEVVVNLALPTSDNAIENEGSVVTALGMSYVHIPVSFTAPTSEDFQAFCGVLDAFERKRVFVHCAANKRVSAFVYLSRVLREGCDPVVSGNDLRAVWEPDGVWSEFMAEQLKGRR